MGTVLLLLVLEACRRTTGLGAAGGLRARSSPTPTTAASCRSTGRSRTPGWTSTRSSTRFVQLRSRLLRHAAGRRGHLHRAVHHLRRGAGRLRRRPVLRRPVRRRVPPVAVSAGPHGRRWPASCSARSPARARRPTVSLGAVTWPILRRAGYPAEQAGGMLAAAGIGAILSPPTLGAAAFIIAEYLGVPYLTVLLLGDDPDAPVLPGHPAGRRDRRPPVRAARRSSVARPVAVAAAAAGSATTSSRCCVIVVLPGAGHLGVPRGRLRHASLAVALSFLDRASTGSPRAGCRRARPPASAGCCRSSRSAPPPGIITASPPRPASGRSWRASTGRRRAARSSEQPDRGAALTAVFAAVARGPARPGGAGDRVVHHRLGHHRAGAAGPRRRRARGGDVRLLLRGAVRGDPADRAGRRRRGRDHRRQGDPDDVADAGYTLPAFLVPIAFVLHRQRGGPARQRRRWAIVVDAPRCPRSGSPRWPSPPAAGCSASARPASSACSCAAWPPGPAAGSSLSTVVAGVGLAAGRGAAADRQPARPDVGDRNPRGGTTA